MHQYFAGSWVDLINAFQVGRNPQVALIVDQHTVDDGTDILNKYKAFVKRLRARIPLHYMPVLRAKPDIAEFVFNDLPYCFLFQQGNSSIAGLTGFWVVYNQPARLASRPDFSVSRTLGK